jgi:replicative DNA helicase
MSGEQVDFSRYGTNFQENLVQVMLDDRVFADQIVEVLDLEFLELGYLQLFVKKMFAYRDKYGSHPSRDTMTTVIRAEIDDENEVAQQQVRKYYARVLSTDSSIENADHIKEVALDFCKKQKLKSAMLKCVGLIRSSSYDEISKTINDALKLGADSNFGYDYLADFEERFQIKSRNPISTGWDLIDKITNGGLGTGELGVIIAPTGVGKSMALAHLGAEAIRSGLTVVHYTLELSDTVVAIRYDSVITGIPLDQIFSHKNKVHEFVQEVKGKLVVKEYPTKTATTTHIKNHLDRLKRRGIKPDLVIVDYGDLLRPVKSQREKRIELESIYEELRSIAQLYELPVWTASQTNRSGLNAEVITMEAISEAFNKCFVADFICTISRTVEDKNSNEGRMYVAKNRNGPDGMVFPMFIDTRSVVLKVLSQTAASQAVMVPSSKDQSEILKERYKTFREQQKKGT